uniref:Endonuclease domain-containing 1 protein n=1 Tax=Dicentrarchus labrax TaxID=13489 RepID=A0A8P4KIP4_DICLA
MIQCLKMVKLKTGSLWFLAAFLFLSTVPTVAEVLHAFSLCEGFLLQGNPPQIPGIVNGRNIQNQNRYKPICQTYNNVRRYLTLYDTRNRIPVFSAYVYRGDGGGARPQGELWKIEPQLDDEKKDENKKNMVDVEARRIYPNQAGEKDYAEGPQYNRGHFFPSTHAFNQDDKISTFTLTNVAPQITAFNGESWGRMERCVKCVMQRYCADNNGRREAFLVVGAQPGNNKLNGRVNIPSQLWSAFCCYSAENKWIASAFWGNNVADRDPNQHMQTRTLQKLIDDLKITAFPPTKKDLPSVCPLDTTVANLYPNFANQNNCDCPT